MEDIRFDRQFRTMSSEGYFVVQRAKRLGVVDLHFTTTNVRATLILENEMPREDLLKLIEQIDEDLVLSADSPRDDFLVSVYIGHDAGFFNDESLDEESSEYADDDDEDDEEDEEFIEE
jgi:succinylglutamate desuccinylase